MIYKKRPGTSLMKYVQPKDKIPPKKRKPAGLPSVWDDDPGTLVTDNDGVWWVLRGGFFRGWTKVRWYHTGSRRKIRSYHAYKLMMDDGQAVLTAFEIFEHEVTLLAERLANTTVRLCFADKVANIVVRLNAIHRMMT